MPTPGLGDGGDCFSEGIRPLLIVPFPEKALGTCQQRSLLSPFHIEQRMAAH